MSITAQEYLKSRFRDSIALSLEITEAKGELGYCTLIGSTVLLFNGSTHSFHSPDARSAFILKMFW